MFIKRGNCEVIDILDENLIDNFKINKEISKEEDKNEDSEEISEEEKHNINKIKELQLTINSSKKNNLELAKEKYYAIFGIK